MPLKEKVNVKQKRLKSNTNGRDWTCASIELPSSMPFQSMPLQTWVHPGRAHELGLLKMTDKERIGAHASCPWDLGKYAVAPSDKEYDPSIASFPGRSHLQYLIAYSIQIWRGKAWEIWSSAVTSGRHIVDTWGPCPTVVIPVSCRTMPGAMNDGWYWHCHANALVSSPRTDSTKRASRFLLCVAHCWCGQWCCLFYGCLNHRSMPWRSF